MLKTVCKNVLYFASQTASMSNNIKCTKSNKNIYKTIKYHTNLMHYLIIHWWHQRSRRLPCEYPILWETNDATCWPNPGGSWSSRLKPSRRPGRWLSSHRPGPAHSSAKRGGSVSLKVLSHRQHSWQTKHRRRLPTRDSCWCRHIKPVQHQWFRPHQL